MKNLAFKPHQSIKDTESFFQEFVCKVGGNIIAHELSSSPSFSNADFSFTSSRVVAELKSFETDFPKMKKYHDKFLKILEKYNDKITLSMTLGRQPFPQEIHEEYMKIFIKPLKRILEKANKQIKETKKYCKLNDYQGLAIIINDGLYGLSSALILGLIGKILMKNYSSIDSFVYLTLNKYSDIPEDDYARLMWVPSYSDRAKPNLIEFVNKLGRSWFDYLEEKLGKVDTPRLEISDGEMGYDSIKNAKFIDS